MTLLLACLLLQSSAAVFDSEYRAAHRGRIFVEVPEVYELVNVAIAMTPTGIASKNLVYQEGAYYSQVRAWFDRHRQHPLIAVFEEELRRAPNGYFSLKMNGYAFEFNSQGRIVQSRVYDRTGFRNAGSNTLRPVLRELQSFAEVSKFRAFYRRNAPTYAEQAAFYRTDAGVDEMKRWLERQFPSSKFDSFKVVFSPLVHGNQSTTWFESNGFRELQPHVNYPYPQSLSRWMPGHQLSASAANIYRGNILFTELNHGYINPEADKYSDRILAATRDRDRWVDPKNGPGYYPGLGAFNEYMNWGLISLRFVDYAPADEQPAMITSIERLMTQNRGFPQFTKFNTFLLQLYRTRKASATVADLYPRIIAWFEAQNR